MELFKKIVISLILSEVIVKLLPGVTVTVTAGDLLTDVVISRVGNSIVGRGGIGTGRITASLQSLKQVGIMSSHISFVALI